MSGSVFLGGDLARSRFEQMTKAISEKRTSKISALIYEISQTIPDLYDQQSIKLLFEYLISH